MFPKDVYSKIKWKNTAEVQLRPRHDSDVKDKRYVMYKVFGALRHRSIERFAKANEKWPWHQQPFHE